MSNIQIAEHIELTSACYNRQPLTGEHSLHELPLCGKLSIRADSSQPQIVEAIGKALSFQPPLIANTKVSGELIQIFWMGPDEWLLHCPMDQIESISQQLERELEQMHHAVVDISDYYTVIQLSGTQSEAVLRRGCPLDLHPDVFPAGSISQTRFGHASVLLDRKEQHTWHIQIRWTYAEYFWDYIVSAIKAL